MDYQPLKKQLVFSDEVKANPNYSKALSVIKACGDPHFKQWLVYWLQNKSGAQQLCDGHDECLNLIERLGVVLDGLVSRSVEVDVECIKKSKEVFVPIPEWPAIELLVGAMEFLKNIQNFERKITQIDMDISNGVLPRAPLTRDGKPPKSKYLSNVKYVQSER